MEISLKSKLSQLLNHGLIYGLTSSLQNVLGFVMLPLLTSYFSPAEFGLYSIILLVSALASAIFFLGGASALGRFYYEEDSLEFKKKIISSAFLITIVGASLLILLSFLFKNLLSVWLFKSSAYSLHIILALTAAAFGFLLNFMTLILRYEKKSKLFMIVILSGVVVNFIVTYILLTNYNLGILAPIYGNLVSVFLGFVFLALRYSSTLTYKIESAHVSLLVKFGIQSSITGLLFYLLDWVDRLIIKELLPMNDVGIYSLGYRIAAIINVLLITPFSLIWSPIRMEYANNNNNNIFMLKVTSYFTVIGCILILMAILFGGELMSLFFKNVQYLSAAKVFPIIMLSILFYGYQNILDFGIYLNRKIYFYVLISAFGLIINIMLNYLLIPHFGYMAAAYISLITYMITSSLIYFVSNRYYKMQLEWGRICLPLCYLAGVYLIVNFTSFFDSYTLLKKIIFCILSTFVFIKFWIDKTEWEKINSLVRNRVL
jgi:O-antigen/teichoic acid export membrane protein